MLLVICCSVRMWAKSQRPGMRERRNKWTVFVSFLNPWNWFFFCTLYSNEKLIPPPSSPFPPFINRASYFPRSAVHCLWTLALMMSLCSQQSICHAKSLQKGYLKLLSPCHVTLNLALSCHWSFSQLNKWPCLGNRPKEMSKYWCWTVTWWQGVRHREEADLCRWCTGIKEACHARHRLSITTVPLAFLHRGVADNHTFVH